MQLGFAAEAVSYMYRMGGAADSMARNLTSSRLGMRSHAPLNVRWKLASLGSQAPCQSWGSQRPV